MADFRSAQIVEISYADLARFDESNPNPLLVESVARAFGSDGLGIVAVTEIPSFGEKRSRLLPLASRLPALPDLAECERPDLHYSVGWSHGKEQLRPGVPDLAKGSYYADPFREGNDSSTTNEGAAGSNNDPSENNAPSNVWPRSLNLREPFLEMSGVVAETGRLLAKVCDCYCRQHGVDLALHETLTRSSNAKGRLLHYFDTRSDESTAVDAPTEERLWCGWHSDHGSLTGLVPAMYLNEDGEEVDMSVKGNSTSGLYIQSRSGQIVRAVLPAGACGYQIGEATQIRSGDLLLATPHAVRTGGLDRGITRETFALFMQPDPDDPLDRPANKPADGGREAQPPPALLGVVPLDQRWKPGCTFGDFHNATLSAFTTSRTGGL